MIKGIDALFSGVKQDEINIMVKMKRIEEEKTLKKHEQPDFELLIETLLSKKIGIIEEKYKTEIGLMQEQMTAMNDEIEHLRKSCSTIQQNQIEGN